MTDFFDLPEETISAPSGNQQKKTDPNIYDPDPNAFNGSYKSVIRFIPYMSDKTKSKYTKYSAKFWNPLTRESLYVDCPSNAEKPSILWTIDSVLRSLKKEEPELHEQLSSNFSRWYTHTSPVYIKKDPQRPELEGQIKLLRFRSQIDQLIEQQLNPEEIDGLDNARKINPYHLLQGKDFLCVVGKKTQQFRDWSKCRFMDEVTPFVFKIGDKQIQAENNEKVIKLLNEFMLKNTPKIDDYLHEEWTEETYNKVAEAVIALIPQRTILNMVLDKSKDKKTNALILEKLGASKSAPASKVDTADDLDFTSTSQPESATSKAAASSAEADDDYDDLFKDL
jgi:hypothetical protein